jgi:hypothetical protein
MARGIEHGRDVSVGKATHDFEAPLGSRRQFTAEVSADGVDELLGEMGDRIAPELLLSDLIHVLVLSWPTVPFDWRAASVSEECHLPLSNS